jgi:hypothetical protein
MDHTRLTLGLVIALVAISYFSLFSVVFSG